MKENSCLTDVCSDSPPVLSILISWSKTMQELCSQLLSSSTLTKNSFLSDHLVSSFNLAKHSLTTLPHCDGTKGSKGDLESA